MYILGISAFAHDAAACLLKDGEIVAIVEEERFTRVKHTGDFPLNAIRYCLQRAGITLGQVEHLGYFMIPDLIKRRILETAGRYYPGAAFQYALHTREYLSLRAKLKRAFKQLNFRGRVHYVEHHLAHQASAFLVSPFEKAAILTIDGKGEMATTTLGVGEGNKVRICQEIRFPHSLGYVYTVLTKYLGFRPWGNEGKVMGLAPYGKPTYHDYFKKAVVLHEDGSYRLNLDYWDFHKGLPWFSKKMMAELGPPRQQETELTSHHEDIACSLQERTNDVGVHLAKHLAEKSGLDALCCGGGVCLNSVMNGKILYAGHFKDYFFQPMANDAGCSLGAALYIHHVLLGQPRKFVMDHVYWGTEYSDEDIEKELQANWPNLSMEKIADKAQKAAELLAEDKIVGWFQGRMEVGPRALGSRSILANPRKAEMKDIINARVKHREGFRPFAPAVLAERCGEYFDCDYPSPYMILVYNVRPEKCDEIPAVTHVDKTGRVQTIERKVNGDYYDLIKAFGDITGTPVILNTSFNVRGEPIVDTPKQAIACFHHTDMDYLIAGNYLIGKK